MFKKLAWIFLISLLAGSALAETTKTVFNPHTSKLDYITSMGGSAWPSANSSGCLSNDGSGTLSWAACSGGSGGGSSTLEAIFGTARSSPTATIKTSSDFTGSVTGSTNTLSLNANNTGINTFTSSITVRNSLAVSSNTVLPGGATFYNSAAPVFTSIQWADGTIQVSSPAAGGATGNFINNQSTLQSGATAYPSFLYVGSSATIPVIALSNQITDGIDRILKVQNTGGLNNVFLGVQAGNATVSGVSNTFVGHQAGLSGNTNTRNTFIGGNSGSTSADGGTDNACLGQSSCNSIQSSLRNTALGAGAISFNTPGNDNVSAGYRAGYVIQNSSANVMLGSTAGNGVTSGNSNVIVGFAAGQTLTTGGNNVILGNKADVGSSGIHNSVAIGANTVVSSSNTAQFNPNLLVVGSSISFSSATFGGQVNVGSLKINSLTTNGVPFLTSNIMQTTTNFTLTDGGGSADTVFTVGSSSSILYYYAKGNNSAGQLISNTDSQLLAYGNLPFVGPYDSHNLWLQGYYGYIAPTDGLYSGPQMGVTYKGVLINPFYSNFGIAGIRLPNAPLQIGYGNVRPNPSTTKVMVNYPGGGLYVAADSDTVHQAMFGVVNNYAVFGSTSATEVHLQVAGADRMVADTSGTSFTYGVTVASLTVSDLSTGECVQTTAGGRLTTTGAACGSGGGGGGSTLETIFGVTRSSPTNTIKTSTDFTGSVTGSTNTLSLNSNNSGINTFTSSITIRNALVVSSNTVLPGGATFYASARPVFTSIQWADGTIQVSSPSTGGGSTSPGGSSGHFQYNNGGSFGGTSDFRYTASSITYSGPGPLGITYAVSIGSITGAGLTTCGDATHGLGWSSTDNKFTCQSITGSGSGGGVSVYPSTATASFPYGLDASTITVSTITVSATLITPNGTSPQIDTQGEIGIDTTADQILFYGSGIGVIPSTYTAKTIVENLVVTDSGTISFGQWNYAITPKTMSCACRGTCTTPAQFTLFKGNGDPYTMTAPTCATKIGSAFTAGTISAITAGGSLSAGSPLFIGISNTPAPTTDTYFMTLGYQVDRQ